MNYDPESDPLSQKAFPRLDATAPAFLWTRILAAINEQEARLATVWWRQLHWMSRLAAVVTLGVTLGSAIVIYEESQQAPLDSLLQGITAPPSNNEIVLAWAGGPSWEEN